MECKQFKLLIDGQTQPGHFLTYFCGTICICMRQSGYCFGRAYFLSVDSVVLGFVRSMFVEFVSFIAKHGKNRCSREVPL